MAKGTGVPPSMNAPMPTPSPAGLVPRVAAQVPRMQTQIANPVQPVPNAAGTNAPLGGITPSANLADAVRARFGNNGLPTGRIL